jgi:hypothetical protein
MSKHSGLQWWFFPLSGIVTEDDGGGLDNPLFPDATVISATRVRAALDALPNEAERKYYACLLGLDPMSEFPSAATQPRSMDTFTGQFKAYLAVRAGGATALEHAEERAILIGSLLSFCFLATHADPTTIALWQMVSFRAVDRQFGIDARTGEVLGFRFNQPPDSCEGRFEGQYLLNRPDLVTLLGVPELAPLIRVVARSDQHPLRDALGGAVVAASRAALTTSCSTRVLLAVNAVEGLLIPSRDNGWSELERRIAGLIGPAEARRLRVEECVKSRHAVAHRGEIPSRQMGLFALALALAVILEFASLAERMKKRDIDSVLRWLDLVAFAQRVVGSEPDDQSSSVAQLSTIRSQIMTPAWFDKYCSSCSSS